MRKLAGALTLILALILFSTASTMSIPDTYISSWSSRDNGGLREYVGGDAYNYIIESGLRGGEIAGTMTAKAIYYVGAAVLTALGLMMLFDSAFKFPTLEQIKAAVNEEKHDLPALTNKPQAEDAQTETTQADDVPTEEAPAGAPEADEGGDNA